MRCLDRDRRRVLIARYEGTRPVQDEQGRYTGRNEVARTAPAEFWPTVTPVRGRAEDDYFGQKVEYDLTLTIDDPAFEARESDQLWVDADPGEEGAEGYPSPHDYVVTKVARTGGFTVIAARRVDVAP